MIEHELPEGWEIKQLNELCDLFNGAAFKSTDYIDTATDTLLIRMGNIRPNAKFDPLYKVTFLPNEYATQFANYILKDGDLIIAMTDMATETKILGIPTAVHAPKGKTLLLNQRVGKLIIKTPNELDYRYIQLYLTSTYANNHYKNLGKGGVQINLGKSDILSVSVILPKISQQKQIVAKIEQLFGELDDGVNILQTLKQKVKVFRQSILKAAFSGKLTGSYVSDDELPAGWEIKRLVDITSVLGDGLHGTPKYDDNGEYYFINGNNLSNGKIILKENTKKVSELEYEKYKKPLTERSILVSINGTLGNIAFYNNEKIILGKSACYFNLIDNVDKTFIKYFLTSPCFKNYAFTEATGTTIKNVSLKTMREFRIPIPSILGQKQIVTKIEGLFATCDELDQTIDNALNQSQLLRQSILKQAFSGKLIQDTF